MRCVRSVKKKKKKKKEEEEEEEEENSSSNYFGWICAGVSNVGGYMKETPDIISVVCYKLTAI